MSHREQIRGGYTSQGHDPRKEIPEMPEVPRATRGTFATQLVNALKGIDQAEKEFIVYEEARIHPNDQERHSHYDPRVRRDHMRLMREVRNIHLRASQLRSVFSQLVATNDLHKRWLYHFYIMPRWWQERHRNTPDTVWWHMDEPFYTPTGIPDPALTDEEQQEWASNEYELDHAALIELEIYTGGAAVVMMRNDFRRLYLNQNDATHTTRDELIKSSMALIAEYLDYWQRQDSLPPNPYEPRWWGHDAHLASMALEESDRTPIVLTPEFDPDVEDYTTTQSLEALRTNVRLRDPKGEHSKQVRVVGNASRVTVTVTAKDGTTQKAYTITTTL